ncbi:transposase [Streptomyces aurantiogriseus]|uniref:transposase n=1 Tax=Streptomyces aurantiogriseus TaxID=66870 RepID=UPI003570A584
MSRAGPGRPPVWTRRQLIDGIRWRARTGAPWRDVPERYDPWHCVYDLFRRWVRQARRPLRGDRAGRSPQRVAVTSTDPICPSRRCRAPCRTAGPHSAG